MKKYYCDGCESEIGKRISGVIIPGAEQKEFCCLKCAQQYMKKMEGKERIEPNLCAECNRELVKDYCGLAIEIRSSFYKTFFPNYTIKFCSVEHMIRWTERERRSITIHTERKEGLVIVHTYHNLEIGNIGCWQVKKEKKGRGGLYVKPETWNELVEN